jgi:hypothetical protein
MNPISFDERARKVRQYLREFNDAGRTDEAESILEAHLRESKTWPIMNEDDVFQEPVDTRQAFYSKNNEAGIF